MTSAFCKYMDSQEAWRVQKPLEFFFACGPQTPSKSGDSEKMNENSTAWKDIYLS
jgi:hypothetical protein